MSQQKWTVDKIIEEAAAKGGWFLDQHYYIRRRGDQCPLSCLDDAPDFLVDEVCQALGIPRDIESDIVDASDNYGGCRSLRKKMLSAFGLPAEDREATT